jgi:hypothetical protein
MPSTAYRIKKRAPSTRHATVRLHPSHPPSTVAYATPAERDAAVAALAHAAAPALAHAVRLTRHTLVGADGVERGGPGMRRALVAAALVRTAEVVEHG